MDVTVTSNMTASRNLTSIPGTILFNSTSYTYSSNNNEITEVIIEAAGVIIATGLGTVITVLAASKCRHGKKWCSKLFSLGEPAEQPAPE